LANILGDPLTLTLSAHNGAKEVLLHGGLWRGASLFSLEALAQIRTAFGL
jgi:hypothetical protein